MAAPSVYLYDFREGKYCLYLGDYTTVDGLRLLPVQSQIQIRHVYAVSVPAVPERFTTLQPVKAVCEFLKQIPSIVDFDCSIAGESTLSSHDDCECHFEFDDAAFCKETLRRAVKAEIADELWKTLLAHPGWYVKVSEDTMLTFRSFDDYLGAQQGASSE
jgi:hypothetical protein